MTDCLVYYFGGGEWEEDRDEVTLCLRYIFFMFYSVLATITLRLINAEFLLGYKVLIMLVSIGPHSYSYLYYLLPPLAYKF